MRATATSGWYSRSSGWRSREKNEEEYIAGMDNIVGNIL
jgi:hypothetical protein